MKNFEINSLLLLDGYKLDHRRQYPDNTKLVYSNFTPRKSRINYTNKVVFFGLQYYIKQYLQYHWQTSFFDKDVDEVCNTFQKYINTYLGPNQIGTDHIRALHNLGYLPIKIKALPEGSVVPIQTPVLTMVNTHPDFFWLTNLLETQLSCSLWQGCTAATIAHNFRQLLDFWATKTNPEMIDFVLWQGHGFEYRGMSSFESAAITGAAHLLSFRGEDTIPAIPFLEQFYNASIDQELICGSVSATEHSTMCLGMKDDELKTFDRLISEVYPNGIVSIVSDTWNLWDVVDKFLPELKDKIMARDGKVVIRPDSSPTNPQDIICGWPDGKTETERKGLIERLWEIFGGTITSTGYKQLDSHIGAIYGDSITYERANEICERLAMKGFASTNCVYGIGSYTYQYNTRDTLGFAMKATYGEVEVNGKLECRNIFKDPATDSGEKKSHKGLLRVNEDLTVTQECTWEQEAGGLLETVFENGKLIKITSLSEIRERLYIGKVFNE